jgi:hypothetical protein
MTLKEFLAFLNANPIEAEAYRESTDREDLLINSYGVCPGARRKLLKEGNEEAVAALTGYQTAFIICGRSSAEAHS